MRCTGRRLELLGCPIDSVTLDEALARVEGFIRAGDRLYQSIGINLDQLLKIQRSPEFAAVVRHADLLTADGQAVVWLSRLLARGVPERVASIDLMEALLPAAERQGYRLFLLGTRPDLLERAARNLRARLPRLRIAGTQHGFFGDADEPDVVRRINASAADALLIAISSPRKEWFVHRNRCRLEVSFVLGVGGALDIAAGHTVRAPLWFRRRGLEWAWRLGQEPARMSPRVIASLQLARYLVPEIVRRARAGPVAHGVPAPATPSSHTDSRRENTRSSS
jgi:N-acetylglucosaminyldiphosphoundecaprenol N-acetyl-beta-D-mannosaminyltransferase